MISLPRLRDRHAPRTDQNGGACGPFAKVERPGGLPERRQEAPGRAELFTIVETGLGSGLNFLAT